MGYQRDDGTWVFQRDEFGKERWTYKRGQHVVFAGPTQNGKTELAFVLLEYTASPQCPAFVAVCKPKDPTTAKWGEKLSYRRTPTYPPPVKLKEVFPDQRPNGYLFWPDMNNSATAVDNATKITRDLINGAYTK